MIMDGYEVWVSATGRLIINGRYWDGLSFEPEDREAAVFVMRKIEEWLKTGGIRE